MTQRHLPDPVVEAVITKLKARSEKGIAEYGVNLTRPDYGLREWLTELQAEALDTANYCEAILRLLPQGEQA